MSTFAREVNQILKAIGEAFSMRPVRSRKRFDARGMAMKVYESSQNHWGGVGAQMASNLKIAHQSLRNDEQPKRRLVR